VPGATSLDPTSVSTFASNALTTFILGGKTQVGRAADAQPTFVSAWIGNNDVLGAAISGLLTPYPSSASPTISRGITPQATFEANYTAMIDSLKNIPSIRGGILIGVVQAAGAPVLFPAAALQSLQFVGGLSLYAGTPITVHPSCLPGGSGTGSLISFQIISAIRDGTHPAVIVCSPGIAAAPVGDIFVLTTTEQATLGSAIAAYNTFIQATATNLGWAYYDPNVTLNALKTSGCIVSVPALGDRVHTFGECVSLDGVHPAKAGHIAIANTMIDSVNATYSTTIAHVSTTLAP
jgi:hypothetical protein